MQTKQKNGTLTQQEAEKYIWSSCPVYYVDRYTDMVQDAILLSVFKAQGILYGNLKGITVPGTHTIPVKDLYKDKTVCQETILAQEQEKRDRFASSIQSVEDLVAFCFSYMDGESAEDCLARDVVREKAKIFGISLE